MEHFGYPAHVLTSGARLIAKQYADRQQMRPILDAVVKAAQACGPVVTQARKTFVALATARRTFARVQPTTRTRVDLGLRLDGQRTIGRLRSNAHYTMRLRIGLARTSDVDSALMVWIRRARVENGWMKIERRTQRRATNTAFGGFHSRDAHDTRLGSTCDTEAFDFRR